MALIDDLAEPAYWTQFLEHKRANRDLAPRRLTELADFAATRAYQPVVERLRHPEDFPLPTRRLVNKLGSQRKRVVYTFPPAETLVLKLATHLLYRYDHKQPPGCYSFRRGMGAHSAIRHLTRWPGIADQWCYKVDVQDYFNSIPIPALLPILAQVIDDDPGFLRFLTALLTADAAWVDGEVRPLRRGVMAGVPLAGFLANLYLGDLDRHHVAAGLPYARYSDDIVVFAPTEAGVRRQRAFIHQWLGDHGLSVNPDKESITAPGSAWEFLGVAYDNGHLDLSSVTARKLKGKIRRKARSLRRWMLRHHADPTRALRAMIRAFDRKFFTTTGRAELNWSRWFFPLLTRDDSLRQIDDYLQQYLRWIPTGRHRPANHRTRYATLKCLGYRTLVNEYHRFHRQGSSGAPGATDPR